MTEESSIPPALRRPRTCPRRVADDYAPPYPAFSARYAEKTNRLAMLYFGIQSRGKPPPEAFAHIRNELSASPAPVHIDYARYVDEADYTNTIAIAYWNDSALFDAWLSRPEWQAWWNDPVRTREPTGYFIEAVRPRLESFETLFSSLARREGVGHLCARMSGEIQEHAYWGSARERIPAAQDDWLASSGQLLSLGGPQTLGRRVRVQSHDHACLIRSGQDWSDAADYELDVYLKDMEPVLKAGMDYLRDADPEQTGCYSCRYAEVLDEEGLPLPKRFGLAWFRSLEHLERWSESHPTHIAIFGTFMRILAELNGQPKTLFYHEVVVPRAEDQLFEYINCHSKTGLLRACQR